MRFSDVSRRFPLAPTALGALLVVAMGTACDEETPTKTTPVANVNEAATPVNPALGKRPEDVKYEATISGLERFMRDLRAAIQSGDEPAIGLMVASLRLQDPNVWMTQTFGDELGAALANEYKPQREEIGLLVEILGEQFRNGLTEIDVGRYQTSENPSATGYQSAALAKMVVAVPLYSVRLFSEEQKQTFHVWSFVHQGESFRFVGKLRAVTEQKPHDGRDLNEYRVSDAARMAPPQE